MGGSSYGTFGQQQHQQLLNEGIIGKGVILLNQLLEGFSKFTYLFGVNFEAVRNFVVSFFGLYKGMSPLFSFADSLTVTRYGAPAPHPSCFILQTFYFIF